MKFDLFKCRSSLSHNMMMKTNILNIAEMHNHIRRYTVALPQLDYAQIQLTGTAAHMWCDNVSYVKHIIKLRICDN